MTATAEKCPYSELFWSIFSRFKSEYGEILRSRYSFRMREKIDQQNSEYGPFHAVCSQLLLFIYKKQPPDMFCKKRATKNLAKFTGKQLCQILFFNKV